MYSWNRMWKDFQSQRALWKTRVKLCCGHKYTAVLMNSQQPWLPAQDLYKIKSAS